MSKQSHARRMAEAESQFFTPGGDGVAERALSATISDLVGVDVAIRFTEGVDRRGQYYINAESEDYADQMRPKLFTSLIFKDKGGGLVNEPTKGSLYAMRIGVSWEQIGGGSNGLDFGTVWFSPDGQIAAKRLSSH